MLESGIGGGQLPTESGATQGVLLERTGTLVTGDNQKLQAQPSASHLSTTSESSPAAANPIPCDSAARTFGMLGASPAPTYEAQALKSLKGRAAAGNRLLNWGIALSTIGVIGTVGSATALGLLLASGAAIATLAGGLLTGGVGLFAIALAVGVLFCRHGSRADMRFSAQGGVRSAPQEAIADEAARIANAEIADAQQSGRLPTRYERQIESGAETARRTAIQKRQLPFELISTAAQGKLDELVDQFQASTRTLALDQTGQFGYQFSSKMAHDHAQRLTAVGLRRYAEDFRFDHCTEPKQVEKMMAENQAEMASSIDSLINGDAVADLAIHSADLTSGLDRHERLQEKWAELTPRRESDVTSMVITLENAIATAALRENERANPPLDEATAITTYARAMANQLRSPNHPVHQHLLQLHAWEIEAHRRHDTELSGGLYQQIQTYGDLFHAVVVMANDGQGSISTDPVGGAPRLAELTYQPSVPASAGIVTVASAQRNSD